MSLEIKISANDMLGVLVSSGIDETEAKAIIFDLLQVPEGGYSETKAALKEARLNRLKKKAKSRHDEDDEEEYEDEEEEPEEVLHKVKKPKRVNFSAFGGASTPLR